MFSGSARPIRSPDRQPEPRSSKLERGSQRNSREPFEALLFVAIMISAKCVSATIDKCRTRRDHDHDGGER